MSEGVESGMPDQIAKWPLICQLTLRMEDPDCFEVGSMMLPQNFVGQHHPPDR